MKKAFEVKLPSWDQAEIIEDFEPTVSSSSSAISSDFHEIELEISFEDAMADDDEELFYSNLDKELGLIFRTDSPLEEDDGTSETTLSCPLRTSCTAHTLQLVIHDGLKSLNTSEVCESQNLIHCSVFHEFFLYV